MKGDGTTLSTGKEKVQDTADPDMGDFKEHLANIPLQPWLEMAKLASEGVERDDWRGVRSQDKLYVRDVQCCSPPCSLVNASLF
jgi:hypothetical protein